MCARRKATRRVDSSSGGAGYSDAVHAEPPTVAPDGAVAGLKLVLKSEGRLCEHYYEKDKQER